MKFSTTMTKVLLTREAVQPPAPSHDCANCGLKLLSGDALEFHLITCSSADPSGIEITDCSACSKSFSTHAELVSHLEGMHSTETCLECHQVLQGRHDMTLHIKLTHFHEDNPQCCLCQKTGPVGQDLSSHFHDLHVLRACSLCRHQEKSRVALLRHFRSVHAMGFRCERCREVCADKKSLANHRLNVHELQVCKTCNIPISGMTKYREHFRERHPLAERTGNTPCTWRKQSEGDPMGKARPAAQVDPGEDEDRDQLTPSDDVSTRMNPKVCLEKLKQCSQCDYATNQRTNLLRHFESVHFTFKCRICFNPFKGRKVVAEHARQQHLVADPKYDLSDAFSPEDVAEYNRLKLRSGSPRPLPTLPLETKAISGNDPDATSMPPPTTSDPPAVTTQHVRYNCHNCGYNSEDYSAWVRHQCHVEKRVQQNPSETTRPPQTPTLMPKVESGQVAAKRKRESPSTPRDSQAKKRAKFEEIFGITRKKSPKKPLSTDLKIKSGMLLPDDSETETASEAGEESVERLFRTLWENHLFLEGYIIHTQLLKTHEFDIQDDSVQMEQIFDRNLRKLTRIDGTSPKILVEPCQISHNWYDRVQLVWRE